MEKEYRCVVAVVKEYICFGGGYTVKGIDVCVQELTGNATWCPGLGRGNVHVIKFKALGQYGHAVLAVCI